MEESLSFYTRILGFQPKDPQQISASPVVNLLNGEAEIQLSVLGGDSVFGSAIIIVVDNVDELFKTFIRRGLDTSGKEGSPVHQGPVTQTWGMREFYVNDPNGNTIRFGQHVE